jgi:hypothetical protein
MEGQRDYSTKDSDVATGERLMEPETRNDTTAIGRAHCLRCARDSGVLQLVVEVAAVRASAELECRAILC